MPDVLPFTFDPAAIAAVQKNLLGGFRSRLALLAVLPLAFFTGLRARRLDERVCTVTVNYRWLNRNPFRSTYWAVLGMAAEMAGGALVIQYTHGQKPSVATLVTAVTGKFLKKAVGTTTFSCESGREIAEAVLQSVATGEAREIVCTVRGVSEDGTPVAEFVFTWSVKVRAPKPGAVA